uniref:hypothetical protein n=1 Tax=Poinsettia branch-inducing phytoplasma TaxID=138647 RepID=UPI000378B103
MFKIKKIIKWFFLIIIFIVVALIGFIILTETEVIKLPKDPIPTFQETKSAIFKEWEETDSRGRTIPMIQIKYTFDGLNGIGYYHQQLQINETQISKLKQKIDQEIKGKNNPFKILELKNELENIGMATYGEIFFDKIDHKYLNENKISSVNNDNISYRLKITQPEPS